MTMRVIDVAPNETPLSVLAERLEQACSGGKPLSEEEVRRFLEIDPAYLETAKAMLRKYLTRTES